MKELLDLKANVEANNQELENKNKTQEEIIKVKNTTSSPLPWFFSLIINIIKIFEKRNLKKRIKKHNNNRRLSDRLIRINPILLILMKILCLVIRLIIKLILNKLLLGEDLDLVHNIINIIFVSSYINLIIIIGSAEKEPDIII